MTIGITMPVVIQNDAMYQATLAAIESLKSSHEQRIYVVLNRLTARTPEFFASEAKKVFRGKIKLIHPSLNHRCVAGAWNMGFQDAIRDGCGVLVVVANDTVLDEHCLDSLVAHTLKTKADLCSGIATNGRTSIDADAVTDGADFSCFAMRPEAWKHHGKFDTNYRPAYFEDNDYYARIALSGNRCEVCHRAQFFHHGSLTIKTDPDAKRIVEDGFEKNRKYFVEKWGVQPKNTFDEVVDSYYKTPFNVPGNPLWFFK